MSQKRWLRVQLCRCMQDPGSGRQMQCAVAGNSREGMLIAHSVRKAREQLQLRKLRLAMALQSKNTRDAVYGMRTYHWRPLVLKNGKPTMQQAILRLVGQVGAAPCAQCLLPT